MNENSVKIGSPVVRLSLGTRAKLKIKTTQFHRETISHGTIGTTLMHMKNA